MNHFAWTLTVALSAVLGLPPDRACGDPGLQDAKPPNIVLIYADDIGYGDFGCYGATKVKTPNCDKLASQGLRLTSGYAPSATCTPSRYAMLTGEYAWRRKGTGVLSGNASLIIDPERPTLASFLKQAGYTTGIVGKWHLGLGDGNVDWNADIKPGPLELGFDSAFIIPATGDRVPCVYVKDHRVFGLDRSGDDPIQVSYGKKIGDGPTGRENPEMLKMKLTHGHDQTIVNGISRIGFMTGGTSARWIDEDMADVITKQAVDFIDAHQGKEKPFFLYFATHDIHVPRAPHARFRGASGCGLRGDVIEEFDWSVGEILRALDRHQLAENTLVILTSDNGPVVDDGYADDAKRDLNGHKPAGPLRGGKYSRFEGGTRVPFIVRWPPRIQPGVSDAIVSQIDLMASFAALLGQELPAQAGPDSENVLPALLGSSQEGREYVIEHAGGLAIRQGPWKLIPANPGPAVLTYTETETANAPQDQLYNLKEDLGEKTNVAAQNPQIVKELKAALQQERVRSH